MDITLAHYVPCMHSIDHSQTCFCFVCWNAKYVSTFDSFHNTSAVLCTSQTRRLCSLTDKRIINQWIDRMTYIFVSHTVADTARTSCVRMLLRLRAFNWNIHDDNAPAVKIAPCGFVALRHSNRYSYCFDTFRIVNWF